MLELKTVVKHAIHKNELPLLMLGLDQYSKPLINHDPLYTHDILEIIYSLHGEVPGIEYIFEKAMKDLINRKNAESFYIALKYQLNIYDFEAKSKASFKSPTSQYSNLLHQSYSFNKKSFEKINTLQRLGIRCNSDKGVSKDNTLNTKIQKLNTFAVHTYNKALF